MTLADMSTAKKCILLTLFSFAGFLLMICPPWEIMPGMAVWGSVLAGYVFLFYKMDGFKRVEDKDMPALFPVMILNAIGINLGGYFMIILVLRFWLGIPIPIGGM